MGISASCNLDDGILKQTLPRTPVIADPDDGNASLSIPNFAEDENTSELTEHRSSMWTKISSKLPKQGSRFSDLKPTSTTNVKMTSSLSAEERRDLEDLQKDVLMEDIEYPVPTSRGTRSNVSQPISSAPGSASSVSVTGGPSIGVKSSRIATINHHQLNSSFPKDFRDSGHKLSSSSDDLNDFNAARFREVNH